MSHNHNHGSMSGMGAGPVGGAPWPSSKYGWVFATVTLVFVAVAGLYNWSFRLLALQRRRRGSSATGTLHTVVQFWRELCYVKVYKLTGGELLTSAAYIGLLLSFLLTRVWNATPIIFWEAIAFRAANLTVAQLPLLFALSTKRNLLAFVLATSYERLNVYHRLVAVCTLTTACLHMGFFLREWLFYVAFADQWQLMRRMLTYGFAAWGLLIFLVVSSYLARPFRYDVWLGVHIVSAVAFVATSWLHMPPARLPYLYAAIAVWGLDRLSRLIMTRRCKATVEVLNGGAIRVKLDTPRSGFAHVTIPRLGLASHPLTLCDGAMTIKVKRNWTRALHARCLSLDDASTVDCLIDGPYATSELPPNTFGTVVLIGGGTGASYIHALALDLLRDRGCCSKVILVEVYRHVGHLDWFAINRLRVQADGDEKVKLFVTRDDDLSHENVTCGRPDFDELLDAALPFDGGESAVYVCGPSSMTDDVRRAVLRLSDQRASKKGLGSEAIYLHVEEH